MLFKVKQPTPRVDGKIGAHPIRKIKKYMATTNDEPKTCLPHSLQLPVHTLPSFISSTTTTDSTATTPCSVQHQPSSPFMSLPSPCTSSPRETCAATTTPSSPVGKSYRHVCKGKKPIYVLSGSSELGYMTIISWLKKDFQPVVHDSAPYAVHTNMLKRNEEEPEHIMRGSNDVDARRTITPIHTLIAPQRTVRNTWNITLEGIFLECVRMFWLISRRTSLDGVIVDKSVYECIATHPVKVEGFLVSETIDICLEDPRTHCKKKSVSTTLSYLTIDRSATVDHLLVLNQRGVNVMKRFINKYSRTTSITENDFDKLNRRLVVSDMRKFYVEPYIRIKTIPYIS